MPSEEVPEAPRVTTDRARAPAAAAVPRVWDLEEAVVVVVGVGVGKWRGSVKRKSQEQGYEINICEGKSAQASLDRGYIGVLMGARPHFFATASR